MKVCVSLSVIFLLTGIGILITLPFIVHHEIIRQMPLTEGSTLFENWRLARSGTVVEFYFFVVSNIQDFMRGEKPVLVQIGPYAYQQTTSKFTLDTFPQNGTVRYADQNSFIFLPKLSVGMESDNITVLNLGYVAIAEQAGKNRVVDYIANKLIRHYYNSQLFFNKTVYEMIWGYEDPALRFIKTFVSVQTTVGLYANRNASVSAVLEVSDGLQDSKNLGQILTFRGQRELSVWKTPEANRIRGSDGSLFPHFLTPQSTVHLFSQDVCRSLNFNTEKTVGPSTVLINSVPTTKFGLSNKTFLSPEENPENRGFCLEYPKCPKSGVLDMRVCMEGAPVAISLPHFNGVSGFLPLLIISL